MTAYTQGSPGHYCGSGCRAPTPRQSGVGHYRGPGRQLTDWPFFYSATSFHPRSLTVLPWAVRRHLAPRERQESAVCYVKRL